MKIILKNRLYSFIAVSGLCDDIVLSLVDKSVPALIIDASCAYSILLLLRLSTQFSTTSFRDMCGVQLTDLCDACIYAFELRTGARIYLIVVADDANFVMSAGDLFINAC